VRPEVQAAPVYHVTMESAILCSWVRAGPAWTHDVGMLDASSAMLSPIKRIRPPARNQPQFIATGPPYGSEYLWATRLTSV
jgi:hypothetical protein